MNRKIIKNYILNLIYQILIVVIPLITIPYITRIFTAEDIGKYSSNYGLAYMFFTFGLLGIMNYGYKRIGMYQDNKAEVSREFFGIWSVQLISAFVSLIGYITIIFVSGFDLYYILLLPIVVSAFFDISWLFIGLENMKKVVLRGTTIKILGLILILILVKNESDLYIYFIIQSFSFLLGYLMFFIDIKKHLDFSEWKNRDLAIHLKDILLLFIPVIAIQIYTTFDRTLVSLVINDETAGFYDLSIKMVKIVTPFITTLSLSMIPRIANLHKNEDTTKLQNYIGSSLNFTSFFSFLSCGGLIVIATQFVPFFLGESYQSLSFFVMVSAIMIVFISIGGVYANQLALPLGYTKTYTIPVVSAAISYIVILFLLKDYDLFGAILAITIAELIAFILRLFLMKNIINKKQLKIMFSYLLSFLIALSMTYISNELLVNLVRSGLILMFINGVIYCVTYCLITLTFKHSFVRVQLDNLKSIISK